MVDRALALDQRYGEEGLAVGSGPLEQLVGMGEGYLRFAREHPAYFRLFRFTSGRPTWTSPTPSSSRRSIRLGSR